MQSHQRTYDLAASRKRRPVEKPLLLTEAKAEKVPLYSVGGWQRKLQKRKRRVVVHEAGGIDDPECTVTASPPPPIAGMGGAAGGELQVLPDLHVATRDATPLPPLLNAGRAMRGGGAYAAAPPAQLPRFDKLGTHHKAGITAGRPDAAQIALYSKIVGTYTAGPSGMKLGVWAEVVLLQLFRLTAHVPSPCPLRTALCCYLLSKLCATFAGDHQALLNVILTEIFNSLYVNYDVDLTKTFGKGAGADAKAAGGRGAGARPQTQQQPRGRRGHDANGGRAGARAGTPGPQSPGGKSQGSWGEDGVSPRSLAMESMPPAEGGDVFPIVVDDLSPAPRAGDATPPPDPQRLRRRQTAVLAAHPELLATPAPHQLFGDAFSQRVSPFEEALALQEAAEPSILPVSPGMPMAGARGGLDLEQPPLPQHSQAVAVAVAAERAAAAIADMDRVNYAQRTEFGRGERAASREGPRERDATGSGGASGPGTHSGGRAAGDATPVDTPCFAKLAMYATRMREMEEELNKLRREKADAEKQWQSTGPQGLNAENISAMRTLRAENDLLKKCLLKAYFKSWRRVTSGDENRVNLLTQVVQESKRRKATAQCFRQWKNFVKVENNMRQEKLRQRVGITFVGGPESPDATPHRSGQGVRTYSRGESEMSLMLFGDADADEWAIYNYSPSSRAKKAVGNVGFRRFAYLGPGALLHWCNAMLCRMEEETMLGFIMAKKPEDLLNLEALTALVYRVCPATAGVFSLPADMDVERRVEVICDALPVDFPCPLRPGDLQSDDGAYAWTFLLLLAMLRWWWADQDLRDAEFMRELLALNDAFDSMAAAELFRHTTKCVLDHLAMDPRSPQTHIVYCPGGRTPSVEDMQEIIYTSNISDILEDFDGTFRRMFAQVAAQRKVGARGDLSSGAPPDTPLSPGTPADGTVANAQQFMDFLDECYLCPGILSREAGAAVFVLGVRHSATYNTSPKYLTYTSFCHALAYSLFYINRQASPLASGVPADDLSTIVETVASDMRAYFIRDVLPAFECFSRLHMSGTKSFRSLRSVLSTTTRARSQASTGGDATPTGSAATLHIEGAINVEEEG